MKEIKNIGNGIIEIDGIRYERTMVHPSAGGIVALFRRITADGKGEVIQITKQQLLRKVTAKETHEILFW